MSWLHCNKCGVQKSSNNTVKFFCGFCNHVLCAKCNKISKVCPFDKRPFNGVEINASMPQEMRIFFEDPDELVTFWQDVIRFQSEQRDSFESFGFLANTEHIDRKESDQSVHSVSLNRTASTSAMSLNESSLQEDSGDS
ncbi:RING finger protein nenya-like isoform X2 [Episyrphus balteatus]|uniref:RING finger protein nenya-like isoform X2 n=1 Tax=Episyrphus balteatus TaxID=286459 RepID=UPI00248616D6|nr:RING finger protein nenya-like isoform X2 [Episyrphus balteatus]